jgi:hypothetical protein
MKINLLLTIIFLSIIIYANVDEMDGIVGLTKRDGGLGCVCHNFASTSSVHIWIEGPDSVQINSMSQFKLLLTGGPAVAGGFDLASYFGELDSVDASTHIITGELTHSYPNPSVNDTISWNLLYTAPNSILTDTLYIVGNSVNLDGIPSNLDQWNFGENFIIHVIDITVPVELFNFTITADDNDAHISWETITEKNNSGFEVQRKSITNEWIDLNFIPGFGTSTESHFYSYLDRNLENGNYAYRLKQVDFNGNIFYSDVINIEVNLLNQFSIEQNYPNPFNPSTRIKYSMGSKQFVTLKVYDVLGNEIAALINEEKPSGDYEVQFLADNLPSGIYLYKLEAGNFTQTKKMILMK